MSTLFISDLHLSEQNPHLTALFERFVGEHCREAERIYILGDLFDSYLGDDIASKYQWRIAKLISEISAEVYLMAGNRDFLIGQAFCQAANCQLLPEPSMTELYGKKTLLLHGDSLCKEDKLYQAYRRFVRSSWVRRLFSYLPKSSRLAIAARLRRRSKKHSQNVALTRLDASPSAVKQLFIDYQAHWIIHGHTHIPSISLHTDSSQMRLVLADWREAGNYLFISPSLQYELVYFTL